MFENEDRKVAHAARMDDPGTTANPGAKFAIGMLAGIAAVLLPRLLALLSKSDDAHIVFFPSSYFLLAAGVGVFLGLVMLVVEYQEPARPKETFMAALGIPAVLSGALGTASTAETVTELARDAERLRQSVRQEQGIVKEGVFNVLEAVPVQAVKPAGGVSSLPFPFISAAHAQGNSSASEGGRFGVRVEQPRYVVVLKKSGSAEQAVQDAQRLRANIPSARAVRSDKGYFVVLGSTPAGETEALLAATQAKKAASDAVQPVLVEVK